MKVTIFTEFNASMDSEEAKTSYPEGMNACLYDFISKVPSSRYILLQLHIPSE